MVLEIVTARIRLDMQDEFPTAFCKARAHLTSNPHMLSFKLMRGIEDPSTFILFIEWDSVAGHMEIFRKSQEYIDFRAILGSFYEAVEMKHYESALYAKAP
jgi:quinol monooxygenase YgiN